MKRNFVSIITVALALLLTVVPVALAEEKKDAEKQDAEKVLVELNSATLEELMGLPGIGEKTGQAIIDGRPYNTVEDLLDVKGIGEKKLEKIKNLVEVKPVKGAEKKGKEEKETPEEKDKTAKTE